MGNQVPYAAAAGQDPAVDDRAPGGPPDGRTPAATARLGSWRPAGVSVGRILAIPITFHWSWLLLLAFMGWSLAVGYFPFRYRGLAPSTYLALGGITAALFCASVLAHEVAHAVVARRNRIPVRAITLFLFGGVAQIAGQPRTPGAEFRMAVVGPLTSLGLAGLFWGLSLLEGAPRYLAIPSAWLVRTNLVLAGFNLLPGFPLDGGRVFRAAIWWASGDPRRATRIAAAAGQLVAYGFMGWGLLTVVTGGVTNGAWQILIGAFLQRAAAGQAAEADLEQSLQDVAAGQVMRRDPICVPGDVSLQEVVQRQVLGEGQRSFLVQVGGRTRGPDQ